MTGAEAVTGLVPLMLVLAAAVAEMLLAAVKVRAARAVSAVLTPSLFIAAAAMEIAQCCASSGGALDRSAFSSLASAAIFLSGALCSVAGRDDAGDGRSSERRSLMLLSAAGMSVMTMAVDLVALLVGLELASLPLYVLTAFRKDNSASLEAGLKYFVNGAFGTALAILGCAFLFGFASAASDPLSFAAISAAARDGSGQGWLLAAGLALFLSGMAFKLGLAPLHMWLPDVYQGAPTPITAFMSAGVKLSVVWVFVRVLVFGIGSGAGGWWGALCALAAITMTVGNLAALVQTNVKRMLAYSSIAHAGYIMLGVLGSSLLVKSGDAVSASSALFYSVAYAVMTVGSFIAVGMAEPAHGRGAELSDLDGLSARRPMLALALSVLMFSLAGMPPTAGFFAKFYVFKAAVDSNLYWLAVLGVVNSLVSFYYYLRIMIHAYMNGPAGDSGAGGRDAPGAAVVAVCLILVLVFGLAPDLLQGAASSAISAISR